MTAFKIVAKVYIGKFRRKISFFVHKSNICLIVRLINRTVVKTGFKDPNIVNENLFDHQIKGTLGITVL